MDRKNPMRFLELYGTEFPKLTSCNNATVQTKQAEELMLRTSEAAKWAMDMAQANLAKADRIVEDKPSSTVTIMTKPRSAEEVAKTLRALVLAVDLAKLEVRAFSITAEEAGEAFKKFGNGVYLSETLDVKFTSNSMCDGFAEVPPKKPEPYFRRFEKKRRK